MNIATITGRKSRPVSVRIYSCYVAQRLPYAVGISEAYSRREKYFHEFNYHSSRRRSEPHLHKAL